VDQWVRGAVVLRAIVLMLAWVGTLGLGAGCSRSDAEPPKPAPSATAGKQQVVLYSSIDDPILRPIVAEFTKETGIEVLTVGDTEATKTTGLVERLLSEKDRPRADVWWSSEPLGSMRLAREDALEPLPDREIMPRKGDVRYPWPSTYVGRGNRWFGGALRARVVAVNERGRQAVGESVSMQTLMSPALKGRVGMARPQFGSARLSVAAWCFEPVRGRALLTGLRDNGLRLYDGNASVVRALAQGEIDVGLTDSDDVHAAKAQGWPVDFAPAKSTNMDLWITFPMTVGLVRGAPHRDQARQLIDYLLGERVDRAMAKSEGKWVPIRWNFGGEDLRTLASNLPFPVGGIELSQLEGTIAPAMKLWDEVMGK